MVKVNLDEKESSSNFIILCNYYNDDNIFIIQYFIGNKLDINKLL